MDDIQSQGEIMRKGGWPSPRPPQDQFTNFDTPNLYALVENFGNKRRRIASAAYEGYRPYPARKPPLAAPVPGLSIKAPPLPPGLEGKLP